VRIKSKFTNASNKASKETSKSSITIYPRNIFK
jgi:hypothetical protein